MQLFISKTLALVAITATLMSFSANRPMSSPAGGEGFEIFLNGKVVLQQFGKDLNNVKTLQLNSASAHDKLSIRYYHCGQVGKSRVITVKDAQGNLIKTWRYKDAERVGDMSCHVQDIMVLKKGKNNVFKLHYSSSELPQGRQLTSIIL